MQKSAEDGKRRCRGEVVWQAIPEAATWHRKYFIAHSGKSRTANH